MNYSIYFILCSHGRYHESLQLDKSIIKLNVNTLEQLLFAHMQFIGYSFAWPVSGSATILSLHIILLVISLALVCRLVKKAINSNCCITKLRHLDYRWNCVYEDYWHLYIFILYVTQVFPFCTFLFLHVVVWWIECWFGAWQISCCQWFGPDSLHV